MYIVRISGIESILMTTESRRKAESAARRALKSSDALCAFALHEEIRQIKAAIDGVLRELRDLETGQQSLPFRVAVACGAPFDGSLQPVDDGVICMACGVRHRRTGAMTCAVCAAAGRVYVADARDPGYVVEVSNANDQVG